MSNKRRNNSYSRTRNSSASSYTHSHSNRKSKKTYQLNYKKLFIFLALILIVVFLAKNGLPKIFKNKTSATTATGASAASESEKPKDITIKLVSIGDIMCHGSNIQDAYNKDTDSYDFSYVLTDIKQYIEGADLAVGNLETTFAGKDAVYSGYPNFNTPEVLAQNLKDIGIDVVSTANNHSLDKRYDGLVSTLDELDKVGISHTGTYRSKEEQNTIVTKNVNGINFAFLSFTYGTNGIPVPAGKDYCINLIDENLMLDQIAKAKELNPDVLCVCMHWGEEYHLKQNSTQEKLADFLFKNGVDIILGNHPHVLEPMEKRTITLDDGSTKDGFVIYSHGNFMSGQVAENTQNSIILQLQITKHVDGKVSIDSYNYVPIYMYHDYAGQNVNYKIMDIDKCIEAYENGDSSVSESLYNVLVKAKKKVDDILK